MSEMNPPAMMPQGFQMMQKVITQDQIKEHLYEEEIELKQEKGGSGLVFYTDAQLWHEQEGDFDEQTADDWDVDMSAYYEEDGVDKDARDSLTMRLETRRRDGLATADAEHSVEEFKKHTKGFGRKVMKHQGWIEGRGLGASGAGMPKALENEGQPLNAREAWVTMVKSCKHLAHRRRNMHTLSPRYMTSHMMRIWGTHF